MSTMQRLTMIGLYNHDPHIFDNLSLPDGYDVPTFIDSFLLEHGEKCVLYPDPDFMKFSIGAVSRKWALELERIYDALTAEYNPIENYDRYEDITTDNNTTYGKSNNVDYTETRKPLTTETTTHGTTDTATYGNTDTTTYGKTDSTSYGKTNTHSQTVSGTVEREVAAFNSSSYEPSEKTTSNDGTTSDTLSGTDTLTLAGQDSVAHSGTDTLTKTGIDTVAMSGSDTTDIKGKTEGLSGTDYNHQVHDGHIHGNIGVMTASSMVSEIVKQRMAENLYSLAGRIFANELLIQIY